MLATQLNHYLTNNEVVTNGVIQLDRYICNTVSGIKIIIILGRLKTEKSLCSFLGLFFFMSMSSFLLPPFACLS